MHFTINLINNCCRIFRTIFHETVFLPVNGAFGHPHHIDTYPLPEHKLSTFFTNPVKALLPDRAVVSYTTIQKQN